MWGFMMFGFISLADSLMVETAQKGGKKSSIVFKSSAVLLAFTVILVCFLAEALVLSDTNLPKYKCDKPISTFHTGSVLLAIPLIFFCFYYMAKRPYLASTKGKDGASAVQSRSKFWITYSYTVVTSGWYIVGCYWVLPSKTCYDKNPNGHTVALAYVMAFLIFLGISATYCCYPTSRRSPHDDEEALSNA